MWSCCRCRRFCRFRSSFAEVVGALFGTGQPVVLRLVGTTIAAVTREWLLCFCCVCSSFLVPQRGAETAKFFTATAVCRNCSPRCDDWVLKTGPTNIDKHKRTDPKKMHDSSNEERFSNCLLYTSPSPRDRG